MSNSTDIQANNQATGEHSQEPNQPKVGTGNVTDVPVVTQEKPSSKKNTKQRKKGASIVSQLVALTKDFQLFKSTDDTAYVTAKLKDFFWLDERRLNVTLDLHDVKKKGVQEVRIGERDVVRPPAFVLEDVAPPVVSVTIERVKKRRRVSSKKWRR